MRREDVVGRGGEPDMTAEDQDKTVRQQQQKRSSLTTKRQLTFRP